MNELLAVLTAAAGGLVGGLVGVGGGILFVPALTIFFDLNQVEAESTSLLMIVIVALAGALRQNSYGNVNLRDAALVGALSPLGVVVGVVVANEIPERALELSFAALALFMAVQLVRRGLRPEPEPPTPSAT
ncbi:MAG: sulfite exporter TauE/SafE family protein [Actinomycetota bacterium]